MNKITTLVLSIGLALAATSAIAQQTGMRVNVLVVESVEDFRNWFQKAMAAADQKGPPPGVYPPSLKEVPVDKKVHFPILVGGLQPPAQGTLKLVADLEILGPDGKTLNAMRGCCSAAITNRPDWRTVLLDYVVNLELDSSDKEGVYTVRVSVTDGTRTLKSSETFHFPASKPLSARTPASTTAPAPRANVQPARNPGGDADKRACLDLPTPAEVIKCTERK